MPSDTPNVISNPQLVEYGKFIRLDGDTRFPAVSVTRVQYFDASAAFPGNSARPSLSSVDVYPKYAVITYEANGPGTNGFVYLSGSGTLYTGNFNAILPLVDTVVGGITALYTVNDSLRGATLPKGVRIDAPITAISANGQALLYYAN